MDRRTSNVRRADSLHWENLRSAVRTQLAFDGLSMGPSREGISLDDLIQDALADIANDNSNLSFSEIVQKVSTSVKNKWGVVSRRDARRKTYLHDVKDFVEDSQVDRIIYRQQLSILLREVDSRKDMILRKLISCLAEGIPLSDSISISKVCCMSVRDVENAKKRLSRIVETVRRDHPDFFASHSPNLPGGRNTK